jgi:FkbM family methyltransferase
MITVEILSDTYYFSDQNKSPSPIVLDCGANIGVFARMALDRGAEKVVCFEPSPLTADCLDLTFRSEIESGRLVVVRKGVWDRTETLRFSASNQANPGSHTIVQGDAPDTITIEVTTVDSLVKQLGLARVDFIKMDIEGAEERALRGASETIRAFRPRLGIGTEHTEDIAANNARVIQTLKTIDPSYRVVFTEAHPDHSPSLGLVLTPYSLSFQ